MRLFVLSALSVLSLQIASPVWAKGHQQDSNWLGWLNLALPDSNWLEWLNLALIILAAGASAVYAVRFNNISKRIERKINSLEMKNCELSNSVNKHSSALDNLLNSRKSIPSASTNNLNTDISKSSPDFKQENMNVRDFIFPFDKERMTSQSVKQEDSLLDYYNCVLSADVSNFDRQQQIKQNWPENVRMSVRNLEDFLERRGAELELEESNDGYFFALSENSYTAVFPIPGKSIAIDPVKEVFDIQGDGSSLKRVASAARFIHNSNAILTLSEKGLIITN